MNDRSKKIMEILEEKRKVRIEELCNYLCYSRSTVRRDLVALEEMGLVSRRNGYVWYLTSSSSERDVRLRQFENVEQKDYIAKLASEYIGDGMTVFMDASTTTRRMLPYMKDKRELVVLTNSIELGHDIVSGNYGNIELFITGGYYRQNVGSVVGEETIDFVSRFRADICFISCLSVQKEGFYEASVQQAYVKKKMMQNSLYSVVVADSSKFSCNYKYQLDTLDKADIFITEKKPPEEFIKAAKEVGCEIRYK